MVYIIIATDEYGSSWMSAIEADTEQSAAGQLRKSGDFYFSDSRKRPHYSERGEGANLRLINDKAPTESLWLRPATEQEIQNRNERLKQGKTV